MTTQATALLVVDVQESALRHRLYRPRETIENIRSLLDAFRAGGLEVVYVQHDGGPDDDDAPGRPGWMIHAPLAPRTGERVFRKTHNSAFRGSGLRSYLISRGIGRLVLVGIQTEYCVDTTCRVAFEHGFDVVIPEGTNTTWDNCDVSARQIYELHNHRILDGRFATLLPLEEVRSAVRGGGRFTLDSEPGGDSA